MPVKDILVSELQKLPRRAFTVPFGMAKFGFRQVSGLLEHFGGETAETVQTVSRDVAAKVEKKTPAEAYPAVGSVEVAVDEFGAVGSLTDNTGVEPDGVHAPFPGFDKLGGDRVITYVTESTDLPDLQVLLAYEEAHKNRKGVVQAVEARLAELGTPIS